MYRSIRAFTGLSLVLVVVAWAGIGSTRALDDIAPGKLDAPALTRLIDERIEVRFAKEKLKPSPLADDAEFLRRVYLDIAGVIPPGDKVTSFLESKEPDKRAQLIEELLESPQYGQHLADVWQDLLFARSSDTRRLRPTALREWLEKEFNDNTPWDKMTTKLLTATGNSDENGAVTFYLSNATVDKMTDNAARLFMGIQLQCAQCHNHPFTGWKQTEYWGMAQFFMKVRTDNPKQVGKSGSGEVVESSGGGRGRARLPESAKTVPAKFLQGEEPKLDKSEPNRPVLAKWLTAPENPFFARAMVNRTWAQFFGRGFVNPIDDMHDNNAPTHPELLQELTRQFTESGFDLKYLIRTICNSKAYQRSSKPSENNEDDQLYFSRMNIKSLTPEQMYDSLLQVLGNTGNNGRGLRGANQGGKQPGGRDGFIAAFRMGQDVDPTEYEAGIPQVLRLMNAPQLNNRNAVLLTQAVKDGSDPERVIENLFLGTLARKPNEAECKKFVAHVKKHSDDPKQAYGGILWALLNASEFALNH